MTAHPELTESTGGQRARAVELLRQARNQEQAGRMTEAVERYGAAIAAAEESGDDQVLSEALRHLAIVLHYRDETPRARELCGLSYLVARRLGNNLLAAEALNTLGGLHLSVGSLGEARRMFLEALDLGGVSGELRARVEQNLGILANIQGELHEAFTRYARSLAEYRCEGDLHGCAIAYNNLGMVSADREIYDEAERYFEESRSLAERTADLHLQALCLVNHAEVDVARQRFENARQSVEAALAIFDRLGTEGSKADAYRILGMIYRDTGRPEAAEAQLRQAISVATATGSVLGQAEATRELAMLYQSLGWNQDALRLLNAAHRLFRRLEARVDLVNVGGKVAELEARYRALVMEWSRSIELRDSATFGHCERVARYAVAMARVLGLNEHEETTILLGAYLHDLGKLKVPRAILHKAGPLTPDERRIVEQHPIWGVELLGDVEFPWDITPIIRSHHEHCDGSGYPDHLSGDAVPPAAQIVGILDMYDGLTTARGPRKPLPPDRAMEQIIACRRWWSRPVFEAFLRVVAKAPDPRASQTSSHRSA